MGRGYSLNPGSKFFKSSRTEESRRAILSSGFSLVSLVGFSGGVSNNPGTPIL
jgi:hypothetical protein